MGIAQISPPIVDTASTVADVTYEGDKIYKKIYNGTGGSLAVGTPVKVNYGTTNNPQVAALADDTEIYEFGIVVKDAIANLSWGWVQTRGSVACTVASSTYTAGHGFKIYKGAVTTTGAGYARGANDFGVIVVGGTTVTSITVYLHGEMKTATT